MVTRIQIAKPDIVKEFAEGRPVLRARDVAKIFESRREFWRLAKSMTLNEFIQYMTQKTDLRRVTFPFPTRPVNGYTWGTVAPMEALLGLVGGGYYSHYTALRIHGLTEQLPKIIYLTKEKTEGSAVGRSATQAYEQAEIDAAFARPPRMTKNLIEMPDEGVRIVMLESAYHAQLGVTEGEINWGGEKSLKLRFTNLERTMIDIVVRPFYAGGVFEVAKAFENAKTKISVNAMAAIYKRMNLGYPYHQAIGYYLERANYKATAVDIFARMAKECDFHITHEIGQPKYNDKWRLYVPEGF